MRARGGKSVSFEKRLAEDLAAFDLGGRGGGSDNGAAMGAKEVDDARDERRFWTDNRKVCLDGFSGGEKGLRRGVREVEILADAGGAGVSWAGKDRGLGRALRELPGDGVLTAA